MPIGVLGGAPGVAGGGSVSDMSSRVGLVQRSCHWWLCRHEVHPVLPPADASAQRERTLILVHLQRGRSVALMVLPLRAQKMHGSTHLRPPVVCGAARGDGVEPLAEVVECHPEGA
jgi:hypothetical protein